MDHKTTDTMFDLEINDINSPTMSNLLNLLKKYNDNECATCSITGGTGICTGKHCELAGRIQNAVTKLEEPLIVNFNNLKG
jgi:hypothetical protein